MPRLGTDDARQALIPLPPLAEQRRIVARVDALMAMCNDLEALQVREDAERHRLLAALIHDLLASPVPPVTQSAAKRPGMHPVSSPGPFADAQGDRVGGDVAGAWQRLSDSFGLVLAAPEDVAPLRQAILQLAVQGRLVEQDVGDEPASVLLERIRQEKARLGKEGKLKKVEPSAPITDKEQPFAVPQGWEWVRLKDFGVFLGGGTPSKANPEYWEGNIPWVSPKDMKKLYIDDAQDHISQDALSQTVVQLIPNGSLLFVVRGMILAHSFPVALTTTPVTINQDMKALRFHLEGSEAYLLLVGRAARNRVLSGVERSTHGTCKLDTERLENLPIPLPPLAEQRRIVARVEQLMALCDGLEARLREERAAAERLSVELCRAAAGQPAAPINTALPKG